MKRFLCYFVPVVFIALYIGNEVERQKEETVRQEKARQEFAVRQEAARQEAAARKEAARQEKVHQEAVAREEAARSEKARQEAAAREEAARQEKARQEAAARREAARQRTARQRELMHQNVLGFRRELDGIYARFKKDWGRACDTTNLNEQCMLFSDMVDDLTVAFSKISKDGLPEDVQEGFSDLNQSVRRHFKPCEEAFNGLVDAYKRQKAKTDEGTSAAAAYVGGAILVGLFGGDASQLLDNAVATGVQTAANSYGSSETLANALKDLYGQIDHAKNRVDKKWKKLYDIMNCYK